MVIKMHLKTKKFTNSKVKGRTNSLIITWFPKDKTQLSLITSIMIKVCWRKIKTQNVPSHKSACPLNRSLQDSKLKTESKCNGKWVIDETDELKY